MNVKLILPPVVKTQTLFEKVYAKQTIWEKLFCQPRKLAALTNPVVVQEVGNCTIETDYELPLLSKFDYKFGNKLYVGIKPFMSVRAGRYRCTVDKVIDQT